MNQIISTVDHYEKLIYDDNDSFHDNQLLQNHMNRWTGRQFFKLLDIDKTKRVLEVGVVTGRLARKVLEIGCKEFVGIDVSPSTIQRAKENLVNFENIKIIKKDIASFQSGKKFDVVFSVLTFQHISD